MAEIPALSFGDVDVEAIKRADPERAAQMNRLIQEIMDGTNDMAAIVALCTLLIDSGYKDKSENILRSSSNGTDNLVNVYHRLHGSAADEAFLHSVAEFQAQLGADLEVKQTLSFLTVDYWISLRQDSPIGIWLPLSHMKQRHGVVIRYLGREQIVGDIYLESTSTADIEAEAVPLEFVNGVWMR